MRKLFALFRTEVGNRKLPLLLAQLGSFSVNNDDWQAMNAKIEQFVLNDQNAYLIKTADLQHTGDSLHFNSEAQRTLGKRFAKKMISNVLKLEAKQ